MLGERADAKTRQSLKQDVAELDQLIDEILLASRLDAQQTLDRREAVDLLALAAEEGAHYDLEVAGTPVTVSGEPVLLRRLIRNLLENARRYAGDGPIAVSVEERSGRAVLDVVDHGPGVPPDKLSKLTTPFYRGDTARTAATGAGLGLAIVEKSVQRLGAHLRLSNADDSGFVAQLRLKRASV